MTTVSDHRPEPEAPLSLCRDEDCPSCGYPETYAEIDPTNPVPGADAIGCRNCGWRVEAPPPWPGPYCESCIDGTCDRAEHLGLTDADLPGGAA